MRLRYVWAPPSHAGLARVAILTLAGWAIASGARGDEPSPPEGTPTFTRDIAPILHRRCQGCHRPGQVGPFTLEKYEHARKRAEDIAAVVEDRVMPPWKPAPGVGPKLKHDKSLTAGEIAAIRAWVDAGAPRGDEAHMPAPPQHPDGWQLGTPDLVLEPAEDFAVPATGPDIYRCFVIKTDLPRDVYITAIEFRPGNRRVVHHMSTFVDTRGAGRDRDAADPGPGYTSFAGPGFEVSGELGFWNAGCEPTRLPEGVGLALPRGADVILQTHYHPSGKPETDRPRLGIYLARGPVRQTLHWNDAANNAFRLPAGESNAEVKGSWYVLVDVEALAVAPHMHTIGRDMRMSVTFPDGRSRDLIHIPAWDPAWQSTYFFDEPVTIPKGSVVKVVAHYDNSDHPLNPNRPPKVVRAGYGVDDEMCVGYIAVVKKGQDLTKPGCRDDLFEIFEKQRMSNLRRAISRRQR